MQVLYDLVRRLILLAILAGFFELLLPGNTFKSYCRLVVGLLVLAMLLQPVMDFLGQGWDPVQMLAEPDLMVENPQAYDNSYQRDQVVEMVEQQVVEQVASLVVQQFPEAGISVRLDVDYDSYGNFLGINIVEILINPQRAAVALVEPIRIGEDRHWGYQLLDDVGLHSALAERLDLPASKLIIYVFCSGREVQNEG